MDVDVAMINGTVVMGQGVVRASIGLTGGRISAIVDEPGDLRARDEVIDAAGLVVLPGCIDPHCHFWDPGTAAMATREDWECGTRSAAAGGLTTVIEMPLSDPPTVDAASFRLKQGRAAALAVTDYALWGGIVPASLDGLEERIAAMDALGAVAYKAFMCWSAVEYPPVDDGVLLETMRVLARRGRLLGLHAENDAVIKECERALHAAGRTDPQAYLASRPEIAEYEAISRALVLAAETDVRLYNVHMTLAVGAALLRQAKARGQRVWVETCPQYLVLDTSALDEQGPYAKCSPPVRRRANVEELWRYVLDETIDTIGSDHAPFSRAEKEPGRANIWDAHNGLIGIETMLPLMLSEGVNRRGLSLPRLAALLSTNTARIFNLYPQKGAIQVGSDGDLTLVDLHKEWTVDGSRLFSKNKWSPYEGMRLQGKVERTLVRGRTVFAAGQVVGQPGFGQQVVPAKATAGA